MTARSSPSRRTVRGRRTEIALIDDLAKRRVVFWKRRGGLFSKASTLNEHTGAPAAVIVVSSTGKLYFSDDLSVEQMEWIIFYYVHCNGGAMPPMGSKEVGDLAKKEGKCFSNRLATLSNKASELCTKTDARAAFIVFSNKGSPYAWGFPTVEDVILDWFEKQRESCVTKEDIDSLDLKYQPVLHYVRLKKSKDISGSGNSGVGAGCDSEVLNDDDIDSGLRFEASYHILAALIDDLVSDGLLTAPVNSAVASGSTRKEPMRPVLVGCEVNRRSSLNLSENNPSVNAGAGGYSEVGVRHDYEVSNYPATNLIQSLLERFDDEGYGFEREDSVLLEVLHQEP